MAGIYNVNGNFVVGTLVNIPNTLHLFNCKFKNTQLLITNTETFTPNNFVILPNKTNYAERVTVSTFKHISNIQHDNLEFADSLIVESCDAIALAIRNIMKNHNVDKNLEIVYDYTYLF